MRNSSTKMEQIKSLKNGRGLQHLLNKAYKIFENPILIHDMEYKAVELNKNVITDDPIWNEYAATGTVSYNWLEFFKNECFIEAAADAKSITFLKSDKLKYDRIYGKVFNKNNIQVGCAIMVACNKPFEDGDSLLFEDFCVILSIELGKNKFYNDYGQIYFEKLVSELINGISDIAIYTAHVESIYMHLKSTLYFAVIDISKADATYTQLTYFRDLFKKTQPEYMYAIYCNYIVIIISIDEQILYVEKNLNKLNRLFRRQNIYAGISGAFGNLFDLNKYYNEALSVLNSDTEIVRQNIFLYEHTMS